MTVATAAFILSIKGKTQSCPVNLLYIINLKSIMKNNIFTKPRIDSINTKIFYTALLTFVMLIVGNGLFAQLDVSVYDNENKLQNWLSEVELLPEGSTLNLSSTDLTYIEANLDAISVQKKTTKRELRKALSTENNQSTTICEDDMSALKQMTSDYYIILYNYNQD